MYTQAGLGLQLHKIDISQPSARSAPIFDLLLETDHVVALIVPDYVANVGLDCDGRGASELKQIGQYNCFTACFEGCVWTFENLLCH